MRTAASHDDASSPSIAPASAVPFPVACDDEDPFIAPSPRRARPPRYDHKAAAAAADVDLSTRRFAREWSFDDVLVARLEDVLAAWPRPSSPREMDE